VDGTLHGIGITTHHTGIHGDHTTGITITGIIITGITITTGITAAGIITVIPDGTTITTTANVPIPAM